ncbi:MAG: phosphodiester glycosidase family protein [Cloacibacillus sp.]
MKFINYAKAAAAAVLCISLAGAAPLAASAVTKAQLLPVIEQSLGRATPDKYLSKPAGDITRADALRLALESMGWGFAVTAVDQAALLPEWPEVEGVSYIASHMKPQAPAEMLKDLAAPLSDDDVKAMATWLNYCKKSVGMRASFPWEGTELLLIKRGVGTPGGPANGDMKNGVNEPLFAAILAVDMNKTPTQIATAVMIGAKKAALATIAAENYGVVGGINGGYFAGAKPIGVLRRQGYSDNVKFWPNRSAFAWTAEGEYKFIDGKVSGNISAIREYDKYTEVLQAGPLLMKDGAPAQNTENIQPNVLNFRHPRTFVGSDGKRIYWGVIDGRDNMHSVGLTMPELRSFMASLAMKEALNLDGGGSSSLWWRGMTFTLPSNAKDMERPIPYAILMFEPGAGVRN